jgi:metallo-beta-lactamase class B
MILSKIKQTFLLNIFLLIITFTLSAQERSRYVVNEDIHLDQIHDSVYLHLTWDTLDSFGRFSSNGIVLIKNGEALMIDTPMDNGKTEILVNYIKDSLKANVKMLLIGHYHDDCLGGLKYLHGLNVKSVANIRTAEKCKELGLPVPSETFDKSLELNFNGEKIVCNFFGGGHTPDNITVWIPARRILFGGCLVKSYDSKNLGNIADAVISDWADTVSKLKETYKDAQIVIPGHGKVGGTELLTHTIELAAAAKNKENK